MKPAPFAYTKGALARGGGGAAWASTSDARLLAGGQSLIATLNMRLSAPSAADRHQRHRRARRHRATRTARSRSARWRATPQAERSETDRQARAADRARHAAYRPCRHPQPRHARRLDRLRRSGGGIAGLPAGARRRGRHRRARRASAPSRREDFFKGLFETALGPQDVLTAIRVPAADKDTRVGFAELARRHGDYAIVGLAASARADGKGLADVRLAYFGVGATPVRAKKAEAALAQRQCRCRGRRARSRSA